jgi:hypothetical protein
LDAALAGGVTAVTGVVAYRSPVIGVVGAADVEVTG